jgi:hypothetical protein
MRRSSLLRISPFLISFSVTAAFFINLCSWIFQCGCRSLWAGADAACNVHAQHTHHCPWCSHSYAGQALAMTMICLPQLAVTFATKWSWTARTLAAIALFPAIGALVALGFGWVDSYWTL